MKGLEITFKSGAQITVQSKTWSTKVNLHGELTSLEWETPDGAKRKLVRVNLDNIDAIVELS